ncbi:hypothetical protein [Oceanirhabdus seepicola]|uniref:Uncharacterized protein n=1 Tax=Oceanirhabdus seepicola TaxID=2828781 RepID=A0A9J6NWU8_9CLOT|nr:hypothetical protein [Oceanirhabdus seepicola]MCM1988991.1 hypothetical protein [Oceanirhabdus seepicola]
MKKVIIILLIFMLSIICCHWKITIKANQSNFNSNITKINHVSRIPCPEIVEEISTNEVSSESTSIPDYSSEEQLHAISQVSNNTTLKIETITLENLVNFTGRYDYDKPLDAEYTGQRTTFYGERVFANIKFSEEIFNTNYEEIIKIANPNINLKTWLKERTILTIGITLPEDDTEQREIDIILPKDMSSNSGNRLAEDTIIKLEAIPHLSVKVVSDNKNFPFSKDKTFNNYFTNVKKNMSFSFSLIFNEAVNTDSVLENVNSTYHEFNPEYTWVSDKELKISFGAVKERIDSKIDLSTALDAVGNRIYTTLLIVIDTGEELSFDLNNLMPYKKGFTWRYLGSLDYGCIEKIVSIENESDKKIIIVNGKIDPHSDDVLEDRSYTKKYTITENSLDLTHNDVTIPLLKGPIEYGNTWSHEWYDNMKGQTTIIKVLENTILTETKILDPSYHVKKIQTLYKMGPGIKEIKYYYDDNDESTIGIRLNNVYQEHSNFLHN